MDFIIKDILCGELIPVILGYSHEATQTAKRMYREYGVISHVFCGQLLFPKCFSLYMKFHQINHTENERLLLTALGDFAGQLENSDTILYLIPCSEEYANFAFSNREELEKRFVIADKVEMEKVWYGDEDSEGGVTVK